MNYSVEIYASARRASIMSQDLDEVKGFLTKNNLPASVQQAAVESLLWQAENDRFPNVVFFLNKDNEPVSIEEFMNDRPRYPG